MRRGPSREVVFEIKIKMKFWLRKAMKCFYPQKKLKKTKNLSRMGEFTSPVAIQLKS